jgi:hypothetical protein
MAWSSTMQMRTVDRDESWDGVVLGMVSMISSPQMRRSAGNGHARWDGARFTLKGDSSAAQDQSGE